MLGIQDAYAGLRKAREASQKPGLTASDSGGHRQLLRGEAVEVRPRAFRPSDGAQNRLQALFSTALSHQVQSLAHDDSLPPAGAICR